MPTLHHLPLRERPAHRVAENGADACSLTEILAAIVGGSRQIEIAHGLLAEFGDLTGLARTSVRQMTVVPGLGTATASRVKAALELGRRLLMEEKSDSFTIRSPGDMAQLLMSEMSHLEQEHFVVIALDTRNRMIERKTLYVGSLNVTHIRVSEVFRGATRCNAAAVIVAHNHPSGDPSPSPQDVEVTRQLAQAGELLDIELLDHLIVGKSRFISLRERGLGFQDGR
ncbi:MAG: DNA repair protein RadC [Chloroflexi bacterium]|nr:DNA repair protein RadC [Chloroflexota bacterium]